MSYYWGVRGAIEDNQNGEISDLLLNLWGFSEEVDGLFRLNRTVYLLI